jgi:hypothetical protein
MHDLKYFIKNNSNKAIAVLAISSFLFFTLMTFQYGVDDSFITYRYAKNLIEHGVWNWNYKGPIVEAYTNFLYAVLAIIPVVLKFSPFVFFKLLGAISIIYIGVRLYFLLKNKVMCFFALFFLFCNPLFYYHAYSGLETPVFIVLVFELIVFLSKKDKVINEKTFYIILLLLPLVRPEGALYSIVGFSLFYYQQKNIRHKIFFILICLLGVTYFVVRYNVYGYLLPNTFYVKSTVPFDIHRVFSYFYGSKKFWGLILLLIIIKDKSFRILLITSVFLNIFYSYSDLQMNFFDRFPFQIIAPFYLTAFLYIKDRYDFLVISFVITIFIGNVLSSINPIASAKDYPKLRSAHGELGVELSKYKNDNLSLMVGDCGLIPYYSEWYVYDFIGLANSHVAHHGISNDFLKKANPDLILLYSESKNENQGDRYDDVNNQLLVKSYVSKSHLYSFSGAVKLEGNFYLLAYLKKDLKKFNEIKISIKAVEYSSENFKYDKFKYLSQYYLNDPGI